MRTDRTHSTTRDGELGVAMILTIAVMVVVAALTITVSMSLIDSASRSSQRHERVRLDPVATGGAQLYGRGLATQLINDRTDYALSRADATKLLTGTTSVALLNSDPSIDARYQEVDGIHRQTGTGPTDVSIAKFTGDQLFTVRTPLGTDRASFWQIYRIDTPSVYRTGSKLSVYVRAWEDSASGAGEATQARFVRAQYSAGRFSDFQMVTDSTILFGAGAIINGPVHSNGTSETPGMPVSPDSLSIATDGGPVNCVGGTAGEPISTGRGAILVGSCNIKPATGDFIDFGRITQTFENIQRDCSLSGSDGIYCFGPAASPPHKVVLSNTAVTVDGVELPVATGDTVAVLLEGDTELSGTTTGRVTIAARDIDASAANITIVGNVGRGDPNQDVLGVVSEGHIIVDLPQVGSGCPATAGVASNSVERTIDAALVAQTGGVRMPTEWTTSSPLLFPPYCKRIKITGSMSAHYAPMMDWGWMDGNRVGFEERVYKWEPSLGENPPPYFPLTRSWEMDSIKDANQDCLMRDIKKWACS